MKKAALMLIASVGLGLLSGEMVYGQRYTQYPQYQSYQPQYQEEDSLDPPAVKKYSPTNWKYKSVSSGGKLFIFDPRRHQWYAYQNGSLISSGQASGGKGYCPDIGRSCKTPVGSFRVLRKGAASCKSTRYPIRKNGVRGGARMDYCMFFTNYYAIHGSNDVPNYNASHGCVRVMPTAARWLNQNFLDHGTRVVVKPY